MSQRPSDTYATWADTTASRYVASDPIWRQAGSRLVPRPKVSRQSDIILLLHERTTPAGKRRVLVIEFSRSWFPDGTLLAADVRLFEPGSLRRPRFRELAVTENQDLPVSGHLPGYLGAYCNLGIVPWGSDFKLYAGQPDPKDSSRFTIDYVHNGTPGRIIGRLTDNDSVSFRTSEGAPLPLRLLNSNDDRAKGTTTSPTEQSG